jgi:hypothetical protein
MWFNGWSQAWDYSVRNPACDQYSMYETSGPMFGIYEVVYKNYPKRYKCYEHYLHACICGY